MIIRQKLFLFRCLVFASVLTICGTCTTSGLGHRPWQSRLAFSYRLQCFRIDRVRAIPCWHPIPSTIGHSYTDTDTDTKSSMLSLQFVKLLDTLFMCRSWQVTAQYSFEQTITGASSLVLDAILIK